MRRPPVSLRPPHALAVGLLVGLAACAGPTPPPPDVAPSDLDVRGLGGAVELTWTAPADADVVAQVRRDDVATWQDAPLAPAAAGSAAPAVAPGRARIASLTDFTPLRFRAALRGAGGLGPWSSATDVATSTAPPTRTGDAPAAGEAVDPAADAASVARCRADGALRLVVPAPPEAGDDPTLDCDDGDPTRRPPGLETVQVDLTAHDADGRPLDVAATGGVPSVPRDGNLDVTATGFVPGTAVEAWRVGTDRPLAVLAVGEDGVARGSVAFAGRFEVGATSVWLQGRTARGVQALEVGLRVVAPTSEPRLLSVDLAPDVLTLDAGATAALSVTTVFVGEGGDALAWSSDAPAVARVDADGVVTAVAPGTATLRAEGANDAAIFDEATVRVPGATAVAVAAPDLPLAVPGGTWTLTADVATVHGAPAGVTWRSSDPSVATVDADGVVTAVAPGFVRVSATSVATPDLEAGTRLRVLASGEVAWTWQRGTEDDDVGYAVTVAPDGTLVLAGGLRTWTPTAPTERAARSRALVAGIAPATGEATFVTTDADPLGRYAEYWDVAVVPRGLLAAGITISSTGGVPQTQGLLQRLDATGAGTGDAIPLSNAPNSGAFALETVGPNGLLVAGGIDASTDTLTRTTAAFWSTALGDVEDVATVSPTASPSGTDVPPFDFFSAAYADATASVEDDLIVAVGFVAFEDTDDEQIQTGFLQAFDLAGHVRLSVTDVTAGIPIFDSTSARGVVRLPDGRYAAVGTGEGPLADPGDEQVAVLALYDPAAPAGTSPVDAYLVGSDADNAFPMAVALLPTGELVIVGQSDDPLGAAEVSDEPPAGFVAIVDVPETGAPELLRSWQVGAGSYTIVHDVAVTDDGWLVLAGETEGSLDGPNAGGTDAFLQLVAP